MVEIGDQSQRCAGPGSEAYQAKTPHLDQPGDVGGCAEPQLSGSVRRNANPVVSNQIGAKGDHFRGERGLSGTGGADNKDSVLADSDSATMQINIRFDP
jgi:hypothetical protein